MTDINKRGLENETKGKMKESEGKLRGDIGKATGDTSEHVKGRWTSPLPSPWQVGGRRSRGSRGRGKSARAIPAPDRRSISRGAEKEKDGGFAGCERPRSAPFENS